jgi:hypothetical protein
MGPVKSAGERVIWSTERGGGNKGEASTTSRRRHGRAGCCRFEWPGLDWPAKARAREEGVHAHVSGRPRRVVPRRRYTEVWQRRRRIDGSPREVLRWFREDAEEERRIGQRRGATRHADERPDVDAARDERSTAPRTYLTTPDTPRALWKNMHGVRVRAARGRGNTKTGEETEGAAAARVCRATAAAWGSRRPAGRF